MWIIPMPYYERVWNHVLELFRNFDNNINKVFDSNVDNDVDNVDNIDNVDKIDKIDKVNQFDNVDILTMLTMSTILAILTMLTVLTILTIVTMQSDLILRFFCTEWAREREPDSSFKILPELQLKILTKPCVQGLNKIYLYGQTLAPKSATNCCQHDPQHQH